LVFKPEHVYVRDTDSKDVTYKLRKCVSEVVSEVAHEARQTPGQAHPTNTLTVVPSTEYGHFPSRAYLDVFDSDNYTCRPLRALVILAARILYRFDDTAPSRIRQSVNWAEAAATAPAEVPTPICSSPPSKRRLLSGEKGWMGNVGLGCAVTCNSTRTSSLGARYVRSSFFDIYLPDLSDDGSIHAVSVRHVQNGTDREKKT
jgi:hypothetical protein